MTGILYGSALLFVIAATAATIVYARAVANGRRAYFHVVLAGLFVVVIEAVAIPAVSDEATASQVVLLAANLCGVGAMAALGSRFRPPPTTAAAREGRSAYGWYQEHRGFVGFAALVLVVAVALWQVERSAEDAADAADKAEDLAIAAEEIAMDAERLAARVRRANERNANLICSLGRLVSSSPVTKRREESNKAFAQRVAGLRRFVRELRKLARCEPPALLVIPPSEREALREGQEGERATGGGAQQTPQASQQPSPPSSGPPPPPPGPGKSDPSNFPGHVCGNAPKNPHC